MSQITYRTLGRTGLRVSSLGMGTGGTKVLGRGDDPRPESEIRGFLHQVFELGINYFDTSPGYGAGSSEEILGRALRDLPRDELVLSTKVALAGGHSDQVHVMGPVEVRESVEASLRRLQVDHVDVLLMAVAEASYFDHVVGELVPVLQRMQQEGKFRFLGSSEQTRSDGDHGWLQALLPAGLVDVAMVGHNMINQSARKVVLPRCAEQNLGVINVFTVRNVFSVPARLRQVVGELVSAGVLSKGALDPADPLGWLTSSEEPGAPQTLIEAAYRYAAHTQPVTAVMCGSIDMAEVEQNLASLERGPLPAGLLERLLAVFAHVDVPVGN